ncbi:MAG: VWA domain-containing protein [Candidatus Omnitrophota bacterium]
MKVKKAFYYSAGISIILHALFFACATGVKIPGAYTMMDRTKRFFNIKALDERLPQDKLLKKRGVTYANVLKFVNPAYIEPTTSTEEMEKEVRKAELSIPKEVISEPITISEQEGIDDLIESKRDYKTIDERAYRDTRKDLVETAVIGGKELFVNPEDLFREPELPGDFIDKMPGFTPKITGGFSDSAEESAASAFTKNYIPAIRRKTNFADLKQYLACELYTYQDPADGQRYYKIGIRAGKDVFQLKSIPKEIVFLIDCSLSIQPKRLERFKGGLNYCLSHLNPEDYFNIAAFKEGIYWFRPRPIKPDESSIQDAMRFVDGLTAGEGTDAYKALYDSIKVEPAISPSYIVLFSDGRPTYGVTDSRRIINEISRFNNGKRPIFAFSAGSRVNRYFLDFISYKNRGWTEYAYHAHLIERHIAGMYEKIKDPMLLNLRYRISGLDEQEVVPKALPDFFKDAEFTLFGRYTDEDEFSLQLLGDLGGETNEFIVVGSLKDAFAGGEDIAKDWAFNKIYYLIGLLEYNKENKDILGEINSLCKKFDIKTPYLDEINE